MDPVPAPTVSSVPVDPQRLDQAREHVYEVIEAAREGQPLCSVYVADIKILVTELDRVLGIRAR